MPVVCYVLQEGTGGSDPQLSLYLWYWYLCGESDVFTVSQERQTVRERSGVCRASVEQ